MIDHEKIIWYREQAQQQWGSDECEISEQARVAAADEGAWVEAWVWIDAPEDFDNENVIEILEDQLND